MLSPYVRDGGDEPAEHHVHRGFNLEMMRRIRQADTISEQIAMGFDETVDSLLLVYRFLEKLITTQVPVTALGGPITIAKATYYSAFEGFGKLLIFLTILSANLAVINFLPIPLLDGGHMVFLAYEGIKRRPPNERFVVAMHTIGFVFIISLMLFVLVLDLGLIKRNL
jgi:regulator of sigma E protease